MLCFGVPAWAQSDTTGPAIVLNAPDGSTTFRDFPTPLAGTVYDAGGMGGLLAVRLYRNYSGSYEKWTGSAWVDSHAQDAYWMATVEASQTDDTYNWSVDVPWPTGAKLRRGSYTLGVTAVDSANNRADIHRTVTIGSPDTTPPTLIISSPTHGAVIENGPGRLESITGTVNDGAGVGVARVDVYLARTWYQSTQWWNGSAWGGWHRFQPRLSAPAADGTQSWSVGGMPAGEQLTTGLYYLDVLAYDYNSNQAFTRHVFYVAPFDNVKPTVDVTFPTEGQQLYSLPAIRGTSADEGSGVSLVRVTVRRWVEGANGPQVEYWSGSDWSPHFSWNGILPSVTETGWTREQNLPSGAQLPPGNYFVAAEAIDRYDNGAVRYRNFSIVPVPPLSIDAHLRADDAGAWLGEGFSNADAQGQTLNGTIAGGETQTRQLRIVRSGGAQISKSVRVTIPDWQAFAAAGWTASFTDARSNIDVTSQITSASGWSTVMSDGDEKIFRALVTAPAGVTRGATGTLTFRVEADPTSETPALDVVKSVWTATVPTPDLSIRMNAAGAWLGEGVFNNDGAEQTLQRTVEPDQTVSGQFKLAVTDAAEGQIVRWSVPEWNAFAADGWTARFYDAPAGGNEITAQMTGEGWTTQHNAGHEPVIRFEASAPAEASDVTRELNVRAQIGQGTADVVKVSLRVLRNLQPDIEVGHRKEGRAFGFPVGRYTYSPTPQTLELVAPVGETQEFAVVIYNRTQTATQFLFSPPQLPEGWSYKLYDAIEAGNAIETEGEEDILTPLIAPNEVVTWRIEVTAGSSEDELEATIPLRFSGGNQSDQCDIEMQTQGIEGAEYTLDAGATWTKATDDEIIVPQGSTLGMKALKLNPNVPWPDDPFEPVWEHEGERFYGELTFLYHPNPTPDTGEGSEGETVRVECGNNFTTKVRVRSAEDGATP